MELFLLVFLVNLPVVLKSAAAVLLYLLLLVFTAAVTTHYSFNVVEWAEKRNTVKILLEQEIKVDGLTVC